MDDLRYRGEARMLPLPFILEYDVSTVCSPYFCPSGMKRTSLMTCIIARVRSQKPSIAKTFSSRTMHISAPLDFTNVNMRIDINSIDECRTHSTVVRMMLIRVGSSPLFA